MHKDMKKMIKSHEKLRTKADDLAGSEKAIKMLEIVAMLVSRIKVENILQCNLLITGLAIMQISITHGHVLAPKCLFSYCSAVNKLIITQFHL